MAENYQQAARRHLADTEALAKDGRFDNAGYLVGYAAECALKQRFPNLSPVHFPDLIGNAKHRLDRRRDASVRLVLGVSNLMEGWSTDLRYASDSEAAETNWNLWHNHAIRLLHAVGLEGFR